MTLGAGVGYGFYMNGKQEFSDALIDENNLIKLAQLGGNGFRWDAEWKLGFAF